MRHIKLFEAFDRGELPLPLNQVLLDGTSSSGKSAALTGISKDWSVVAVDSFYNLLMESIGEEDFGNSQKPDLTKLYPGCPYRWKEPFDSSWERAARWYMAQDVKWGRIRRNGLKDKNGLFGRSDETNVVYDDVQGTILGECPTAGLPRPKWVLVHAPIDHLVANIARRKAKDARDPRGVFVNAYCFKYEALPVGGGVDPLKPWTGDSIRKTLGNPEWAGEFISKLGIKNGGEYWIHAKVQPEGSYDSVVNTRTRDGAQMSLQELSKRVRLELNT